MAQPLPSVSLSACLPSKCWGARELGARLWSAVGMPRSIAEPLCRAGTQGVEHRATLGPMSLVSDGAGESAGSRPSPTPTPLYRPH